jgi:hypothetical protein
MGGRKTLEEELANYREKIKQITLEELATSRVYKHLTNNDDDKAVKEIALPVYLKSKADKIEQKIDGKLEIVNYADTIQLPTEGLPTATPESIG